MKRSNYRGYVDQLRELENQVDAKDPFNSGVMKAIESSKASLGLSRDQEHKAIRKGLNTFSSILSEKFGNPFIRKKGVVDNLASVAPAASAGLEAYDDAEDEIKHDIREMVDWAKKFRDDELKRLEATDKEGYDRYMAGKKLELEQQKLDEQRDYHQGKLANSIPVNNTGADFIHFDKAIEAKPYKADKKEFGTGLSKITEIEDYYHNFRNKYKDNIADPMGPFSGITNPIKDSVGKFADSKVLRDETSDRKTLNSMLNEFIIQNENALRGGGVLGPKLIQVFKDMNIYPSLDRDTPEDFIKKLTRMKEEMQKYYDTANYALKYNVHLDPSELDNFKLRYLTEEAPALKDVTGSVDRPLMQSVVPDTKPKAKSVRLYDPDTYQYFSVPENDLADVIRDYPKLIEK